jgi:hypothetical protein
MLKWISNPGVDEVFGVPLHVTFSFPLPVLVQSREDALARGLYLSVEDAEARALFEASPSSSAITTSVAPKSESVPKHRVPRGPIFRVSPALWKNRGAFGCMARDQSRVATNYNVHITDKLRELVSLYSAKLEVHDDVRLPALMDTLTLVGAANECARRSCSFVRRALSAQLILLLDSRSGCALRNSSKFSWKACL